MLIKAGADPSVPTDGGDTSLQIAEKEENNEVLALLSKKSGGPRFLQVDSAVPGHSHDMQQLEEGQQKKK